MIIKALEDELDQEQKRRKDIGKSYKTQVKEFEDEKKSLDILKKKSDALEAKK
jgi:thymidylate synthase